MVSRIDLDAVNRFRLHKQHLADESKTADIVQIVRDIYGLHATNPTTPYLSLFARAKGFTREKLEDQLYVERTLGKIRCVRTTVYVLPREAIPISFAATKSFVEPNSEDFLRYTGAVTEKQYEDASREILSILKGQGMSTLQIKKQLGSTLNVSPIVNLMCDQGLLMRGRSDKGWKSNTHTYYRFDDYFPGMDLNAIVPAKARETTVKQYLAAFGPATVKDISWWSGFTMTEVRSILQTLAREITEVEIQQLNGKYVMLAEDRDALERFKPSTHTAVNLLPALDPYPMGYKEREHYLDNEQFHLVFDRSGNSTSTILVDGRAAGVWDFSEKPKPTIKLFLFRMLNRGVLRLVESRARAVGQFIADKPVAVEMCDQMVPLPQRNAGGFMSPLAPSTGRRISSM